MLYLFDLDGTLITNYMDDPEKKYDSWSLLPGRKERLLKLRMQGHKTDIVTNQRGVSFGYVTEEQARDKLATVRRIMGADAVNIYHCFSDVRGKAPWDDENDAKRAKPNPHMLYESIAANWEAAKGGVIMVGDREEDQQAAEAARVDFLWADDFFLDENEREKEKLYIGYGTYGDSPIKGKGFGGTKRKSLVAIRNPTPYALEVNYVIYDMATGISYTSSNARLIVNKVGEQGWEQRFDGDAANRLTRHLLSLATEI